MEVHTLNVDTELFFTDYVPGVDPIDTQWSTRKDTSGVEMSTPDSEALYPAAVVSEPAFISMGCQLKKVSTLHSRHSAT